LPSSIFYEQPLNERIRLLMRLEYVFHYLGNPEPAPIAVRQHLALNSLLDLIDLIHRGDTCTEVIKELERISANLIELRHLPGVDADRLNNILDNLTSLIARLNGQNSRHFQTATDAELLSALRRRHNVTCGNTEFDQPLLQHWLLKPEPVREELLQTWAKPFETLKLAVKLALQLIRESAGATPCVAESGFYQHTLDTDQPAQIIRVCPDDPDCYPVISAGRHRFTIRFMRQQNLDPALQVEDSVNFKLICCSI